jgi:Leucine-rich repeat (LRR) protein
MKNFVKYQEIQKIFKMDSKIYEYVLQEMDPKIHDYVLQEMQKVEEGKKYIDLSYLGLKVFPDILFNIRNFNNIEALRFQQNKFISLPEELFNFINLGSLDLRRNEIVSIPNSIEKLTNLNTLPLGENCLTSISNSLGNLTNLHYLYLDNNKLTSLPNSLGKLTNLTYLCMNGNPTNEFPHSRSTKSVVLYYQRALYREKCLFYFAKVLNCTYPILISLHDSWNLENLDSL